MTIEAAGEQADMLTISDAQTPMTQRKAVITNRNNSEENSLSAEELEHTPDLLNSQNSQVLELSHLAPHDVDMVGSPRYNQTAENVRTSTRD